MGVGALFVQFVSFVVVCLSVFDPQMSQISLAWHSRNQNARLELGKIASRKCAQPANTLLDSNADGEEDVNR
jgi:hypothetical protein